MRIVYRRRCSARPLFWLCCLLCFPCALPSLLFTRSSASGFILGISCLFLSASFSLCRYLRSCIGAPLLHSVSSHPRPTHTLCPCTVGRMHVHAQHSKQLFSPIPTSHLTAYYCGYPRRGLTAGNINRTARTDMHTHMQTHTEPLILGRPRTEHPPTTYRPPFSVSHNYANRLAAARYPPEIALYSTVYHFSVSLITPYLTF